MKDPFAGKVALVTGAGSGIGLATAKAFAEAGASVVMADMHKPMVRAAAEELIAGGRSLAVQPRRQLRHRPRPGGGWRIHGPVRKKPERR